MLMPFAFFTGCAAVELSEAGRGVSLVGTRYQPKLEAFELVGSVSASCTSRYSRASNLEACQHEIRNEAAAKGANLVVIESRTLGRWWCDACVKLEGKAYRRRIAPPPGDQGSL